MCIYVFYNILTRKCTANLQLPQYQFLIKNFLLLRFGIQHVVLYY